MKCSLQKEIKRVESKILFEQIYNLESLFCAWKKSKYIYDTESDFIFRIDELAEFEAKLQSEGKEEVHYEKAKSPKARTRQSGAGKYI